jgi:hypothetical protein
MVRIIASSLLTLALCFSVASADDVITANQLESLVSAVANLADGGTTTVTLNINGADVSYTVTKDALGNITATGPANAQIQTIAISTGSSGTAANIPLAATVITAAGGISSFNIATNSSGQITGVTSANDTVVKGSTGANGTQTTTTTTSTGSGASGISVVDTITTITGGGGSTTGTVTIVFAPGTSTQSSTVISPH